MTDASTTVEHHTALHENLSDGEFVTTTRYQISLHDNYVPVVTAGEYTVKVDHRVTTDKAGPQQGQLDTTLNGEKSFSVTAPRFGIDPGEVFAAYPPPAARGNFETAVPHLTLSRASLPWERTFTTQDRTIPWVALLLLKPDEVATVPPSGDLVVSRPVKELTGVNDNVELPELGTIPPPIVDGTCRTLDLDKDAVGRLLPTKTELPYLVHARDVGVVGQRSRDERWAKGRYCVLLGNRLARRNTRYTAALVSLEGHSRWKVLGGDKEPSKPVRFVVLWSWSFETDTSAEPHFGALAAALAKDAKDHGATLRLRTSIPSGGHGTEARERIECGYVPVLHRLPGGEDALGWYRGPLTPEPARTLPTSAPPATASEALIYSQKYGTFDVSYASAFTLGRLMAVADQQLSRSLVRFRADALRAVQRATARTLGQAEDGTEHAVDRFTGLVENGLGKRLTDELKKLSNKPTENVVESTSEQPPTTTPVGQLIADALTGAGGAALVDACARALDEVVDSHLPTLGEAGLDAKKLFDSLPFHHLVPDAALLPPEALRFCYVDNQWMAHVVAGVANLGVSGDVDAAASSALLDATTRGLGAACGMLLRSRMVQHWPALIVEASESGKTVGMRPRRPAPDVLLVLFESTPDKVVIREPAHALNFGLDIPVGADNGKLYLRNIANDDPVPGKKLAQPNDRTLADIRVLLRTEDSDVLNLTNGGKDKALVPAMAAALKKTEQHPAPKITSALLALQLANSPKQLTLTAQ
ncbi:hypothetical protein SAMN04487905_1228 [Actinopolyspora xinjiangensis]|uniref:Uncharacterized protein n=1 Tax=Actinopolyspora xinjiangensis TaxID=405564 RepID=A0A1H0X1N9_9ACTN|nr:hypothetical protein [Actinopolyspora xinjiangensis]SDP96863.1 hypothetical protein SAMN04487905_1228 [Actinopolyspora xinjiangensis]